MSLVLSRLDESPSFEPFLSGEKQQGRELGAAHVRGRHLRAAQQRLNDLARRVVGLDGGRAPHVRRGELRCERDELADRRRPGSGADHAGDH